jgi:enolase-phosphatase E1
MKAILLDVEGTTTPIDFVYKTLFPFARKRMKDYATDKLDNSDLSLLKSEFLGDNSPDKPDWSIPPIDYLYWLMEIDRKSPALKSIQGKIWQEGYENGIIRGELFPDVFPAIKLWKSRGIKVAIYSSGSILAQKLLFKHSQSGDISILIDGYFDTTIGPKKEPESYKEISKRLNLPAGEIVFISDMAAECEAAKKAECGVRYSIRPGNNVEAVPFKSIRTFEEIEL